MFNSFLIDNISGTFGGRVLRAVAILIILYVFLLMPICSFIRIEMFHAEVF